MRRMYSYGASWVRIALVLVAAAAYRPLHSQCLDFRYFLGPGPHVGFQSAYSIAARPSGGYFVFDSILFEVLRFEEDGTGLIGWGGVGNSHGKFGGGGLSSIALGPDGALYVADPGNDRVEVFDAAGNWLRQIGTPGSEAGQLNDPSDVDFSPLGHLYVADTGNNRVQSFDLAGNSLAAWTGLNGPKKIAFATDGSWYVLQYTSFRKYDAAGTFIGQYNPSSLINYDSDILVSGTAEVLVADTGDSRILRFSNTGAFLGVLGTPGSGPGQFASPAGLAWRADGKLLVGEALNDRVQILEPDGTFIKQIKHADQGAWTLKAPFGAAFGLDGSMYVADSWNDRIVHYDSQGTTLGAWGTTGSGSGQFNLPEGVAIGPDGSVYVADRNNNRIQRFDATGNSLGAWGVSGSGNGQFQQPNGVAVDESGRVFVSDFGNRRIQRFSAAGIFEAKWGSHGTGAGQFFNGPVAMAYRSGKVYVAEANAAWHRIQRFDADGSTEAAWTVGTGIPPGINGITGLAVAPGGRIYFSDQSGRAVYAFDSDGSIVGKVVDFGSRPGKAWAPFGLAIDAAGDLLVTDAGNTGMQRVQRLGCELPGTPTPTQTTTQTASPSPSATPSASPTASPSASPTYTDTPAPSATLTLTPAPSGTASYTPTVSTSSTQNITPTISPSATPSSSPSGTFTVTLTATPTTSGTPTPTPNATLTSIALSWTPTAAYARNTLGLSVVAGPVPVKRGQALCLYFSMPPKTSYAELFNVLGESVIRSAFGAEAAPCLETQNLAPGVYLLRLKADAQERWQKVAIVP